MFCSGKCSTVNAVKRWYKMLTCEEIKNKLAIVKDILSEIRGGTSDSLRLLRLARVEEQLHLYQTTLDEEEEPRTAARQVDTSDDELYTPNAKKQKTQPLEDTEGLQLRGSRVEHETRRPTNTPVEPALQPLNFQSDHEPSEGEAEESPTTLKQHKAALQTLLEETPDFDMTFYETFVYCLEHKLHPATRSAQLRKVIARYVTLGTGSVEIKVTATDKNGGFHLSQVRLRNNAHLFFCFDIPTSAIYTFLLSAAELRGMLRSGATYHHSPEHVGAATVEINEGVEYEIKPSRVAGAGSKARWAWDHLEELYLVDMTDLPQILIEKGFGTLPPPAPKRRGQRRA